MKFYLATVITIFLISGCQTTPKLTNVDLPGEFRSLFTSCAGGDGAISLQVYKQPQQFLGSAELEWISRRTVGWSADVLSPIGQTVLKLNFDAVQSKIVKSGELEAKLPELGISKNGYLELDKNEVKIRPQEMPCFLGFRLPEKWLNDIVSFERGKTSSVLTFIDGNRQISVKIEHTEHMQPLKVCSTVKWQRYLGLVRSEVVQCFNYEQPPSAELTGSFAYLLRWIQLDVQE